MVLIETFAEVMQQEGQVQDVLPVNLPIDFPEHTPRMGQRLSFRDPQQAVLVHGVLVVLVELHEPPHPRKGRDQLLQQIGAMHGLERARHGAGP